MGLSASQARLLSITARLSDNELKSQMIANSKIRLADQTQEASAEYMEALSATKLMYTTYDAQGNATQMALTPAIIYEYSDLKNQYGISNTSGQLLVNSTDARNFEASDTVNDFVQCYGVSLTDNPKYEIALKGIYGNDYTKFHNTNNVYELNNTINGFTSSDIESIKTIISKDSADLTAEDGDMVNNVLTTWNNTFKNDLGIDNSNSLSGSFGNYVNNLLNLTLNFPQEADYIEEVVSGGNSDLAAKFTDAAKSCYNNAMNTSPSCYLHVLAHLLDLNVSDVNDVYLSAAGVASTYQRNYTTTVGDYAINITSSKINGSAIQSSGKTSDMAEVSEYICDPANNVMAMANPDDTTTEDSSDLEKLLSNYKFVDGEKVLKTFKEKIIDLYYVVQNRSSFKNEDGTDAITYNELKPYLEAFQTELAGSLTSTFNEEQYLADIDAWKLSVQNWIKNIEASKLEYLEDIDSLPTSEIPDETDPKTAWYVNLWHRMNGESDYKSQAGTIGTYYKQLEDNLLSSADWLKFALEHGVVTMEKVQFVDEAEDGTGLKNSKWQSAIYSTCTDISEVDDEIAIAKAEAQYNKKLNEIEAKDKKYDNDIKKLDTEHSAMQTEYESIQSVIEKNVERSFKAFS